MSLWIIIAIIAGLYWKTCKAFFLIDDYTARHKYPMPEIASKDPKFYMTKPHWWVHPFMIGMHCVNTSVIYMLWGWEASLLFAVHPMGLWGAAWVTGNYYATTTYFLLIGYFFIHTFPGWGMIGGAIFYWVAMCSTFDAIPFPFVLLCSGNPLGVLLIWPMAIFLNGKKFRLGLSTRKGINEGKVISRTDFPLNRLAFMVKVVARYTFESIIPMRVKLFDDWAESIRDFEDVYKEKHAWNAEFWLGLALMIPLFILGLLACPLGILWFFILIGLHCQFNLVGQTYAQRYIYIALPGLCAVAGVVLSPWPMVVVGIAGFFACRTYIGTRKFLTQENMLMDDCDQVPTRGDSYGLLGQLYLTIMPLDQYPPFMINMIAYLIRRSVDLNPRSWQMHMNFAAYLCKTGYVDQGLEEMDKTIELLEKYSCNREKKLINEMIDQKKNWKKIGKDLKMRAELDRQTKKAQDAPKIIIPKGGIIH